MKKKEAQEKGIKVNLKRQVYFAHTSCVAINPNVSCEPINKSQCALIILFHLLLDNVT